MCCKHLLALCQIILIGYSQSGLLFPSNIYMWCLMLFVLPWRLDLPCALLLRSDPRLCASSQSKPLGKHRLWCLPSFHIFDPLDRFSLQSIFVFANKLYRIFIIIYIYNKTAILSYTPISIKIYIYYIIIIYTSKNIYLKVSKFTCIQFSEK